MTNFVLEIFSEEIPAKMQKSAVANFLKIANEVLLKNNLNFDSSQLKTFISPLRLVLIIERLNYEQLIPPLKKTGPKISADKKAIDGFLKSVDLRDVKDLEIVGEFFVYNRAETKIKTSQIISSSLPQILQKMQSSWPKLMRWNIDSESKINESELDSVNNFTFAECKWIRPIRNILAMFGDEIINLTFANLKANNLSFNKKLKTFAITNAKDYEHILDKKNIVVNHETRRQKIISQIHKIVFDHQITTYENLEKSNLFEEIIGLCENPTVLVGEIDKRFLNLPREALVITLQSNQKYLCCHDKENEFSSKFIFICDCEVDEKNIKKIIADNEKIVRARLSDLQFFIEQDLKNPLESNFENLRKIIFHQKLGSVYDKALRLKEMSRFISLFVPYADLSLIERATKLCKSDLLCKAVAEMPELQGKIGSFYAQIQKEDPKIVSAIFEHYLPLGPSSDLPETPLGITLSIADKIDSIVGFYLIEEKPTSSKDPYALRRCALGIIRTSFQHNIAFPIRILIEKSLKSYPIKIQKAYLEKNEKLFLESKKTIIHEIVFFIIERLKVYLKDQEFIRHDVVNAVTEDYLSNLDNHKYVDILFLAKKIKFIDSFFGSSKNSKIIELYKRSINILTIQEKKEGKKFEGKPSTLRFKSKEEKNLYKKITQIESNFRKKIKSGEFLLAFELFEEIVGPMSQFFDNIIVICEDKDVRENRLMLLNMIRKLFHEIGDISEIDLKLTSVNQEK